MTRLSGALLVAGLLALDQFTKYLVETSLPMQEKIDVLPFLALYRTFNTGIAFSFLSGMDDLALSLLTLAITGFVLYLWARSDSTQRFAQFGYALVIGGALGNLIDRLRLGHVVDFILFHTPNWSFAVFNLADSFITIGAMLIILQELFDLRGNRAGNA
jgi:signal peptidase II